MKRKSKIYKWVLFGFFMEISAPETMIDPYTNEGFEVFGNCLLSRLRNLHPNIPMTGRFKIDTIPDTADRTELYYKIKERRGCLASLVPFSGKLVEVYLGGSGRGSVEVYDSRLVESVREVVDGLNEETESKFELIPSQK